jgi:hypothetical protein
MNNAIIQQKLVTYCVPIATNIYIRSWMYTIMTQYYNIHVRVHHVSGQYNVTTIKKSKKKPKTVWIIL